MTHPSIRVERVDLVKNNQEKKMHPHQVSCPRLISDIEVRMVARVNMMSSEVYSPSYLEVHREMTASPPIIPTFSVPTTPA